MQGSTYSRDFVGKASIYPQLPGNISLSSIFRRDAFGVYGNSKSLGHLVIEHRMFVPIIRLAGQENQGTMVR